MPSTSYSISLDGPVAVVEVTHTDVADKDGMAGPFEFFVPSGGLIVEEETVLHTLDGVPPAKSTSRQNDAGRVVVKHSDLPPKTKVTCRLRYLTAIDMAPSPSLSVPTRLAHLRSPWTIGEMRPGLLDTIKVRLDPRQAGITLVTEEPDARTGIVLRISPTSVVSVDGTTPSHTTMNSYASARPATASQGIGVRIDGTVPADVAARIGEGVKLDDNSPIVVSRNDDGTDGSLTIGVNLPSDHLTFAASPDDLDKALSYVTRLVATPPHTKEVRRAGTVKIIHNTPSTVLDFLISQTSSPADPTPLGRFAEHAASLAA